MDAMLTLYILAGCVALAVVVFVVMGAVTALRAPRLPDVAAYESPSLPVRALTPRPLPVPAAIVALQPLPARGPRAESERVVPRTVIPLPPIAGVAPATRAQSSPSTAHASLAAVHAVPTAPPPSVQLLPIAPSARALTPSRVEPPPLPTRMPRATRPPSAPAVARPAPPAERAVVRVPPTVPIAWAPPVASNDDWSDDPGVAILRRSETTLPTYRERPSMLRTVIGWTFATLLVALAPVVVEPTLVDPLCDDYEWDGAEAAAIVRDYAREANVAIALEPVRLP